MKKQIFTQSHQPEEEEILPKQEFHNVETTIDNEPLEGELLDEQFEQIVKPKSSGWKTALKLTALLFLPPRFLRHGLVCRARRYEDRPETGQKHTCRILQKP